jgi:hypothetical protein
MIRWREPPALGSLVAIGLLAGAVVASASPAHAQSDYERDYSVARALHSQGKLVEARERYRAALGHRRTVEAVCNLGTLEHELGSDVEASFLLSECLASLPTSAAEKRPILEQIALDARANVGTVVVTGASGAVEVAIDEAPRRALTAANEAFVEPSRAVKLTLHHDGVSATSQLTVPKGGSLSLDAPRAAQPVLQRGSVGTPPSVHTVSHAGPGWRVPVLATLGAIGGAAALTGAGLTIASTFRNDEGDSLAASLGGTGCPAIDPSRCAALVALRREQDLLFNVGIPLLATGAALGVGALVGALVPEASSKHAASRWGLLLPQLAQGQVGAAWAGSF